MSPADVMWCVVMMMRVHQESTVCISSLLVYWDLTLFRKSIKSDNVNERGKLTVHDFWMCYLSEFEGNKLVNEKAS